MVRSLVLLISGLIWTSIAFGGTDLLSCQSHRSSRPDGGS
jgi:hypothetical protein